ncbi:MAG: ARMT1-like domain-containing protein, partial [Thermodesulfobacteriota bacterium]|nr:ARMT1-like domain-containing protein [Thermodesulfobacteriota bacterium]
SNGTNCPGTPLSRCSAEFREAFNQADLIISKGQGNFETLSEVRAPIYFLLSVKCPVVARHIFENTGRAVENGDMILLKGIG